MSRLDDVKKSEIAVGAPARPGQGSGGVMLTRGTFTDEQLERAGARGSIHAAATRYDFCPTANYCTTYTTTCARDVPLPQPTP